MSSSPAPPPHMVFVGEAMVDLIGEQRVASMREVARFAPHSGGAVANVAAVAARAGAAVALAGAAGDDEWGRWLIERLSGYGVDMSRFALLPGVGTQLAFAAVDGHGDAAYELWGEASAPVAQAFGEDPESLLQGASGLLISSGTLAGTQERELTMRVRELALARELPVVFSCSLRLDRWSTRADAAASANACVPGAALVCASRAEAELMTGEEDPERAAMALRKAGAGLVAITLGAEGAILRGAERADVAAVAAEPVLSTIGAGGAFFGTLVARLALSGFYPSAVAAAMGEAANAAARACERWGALE